MVQEKLDRGNGDDSGEGVTSRRKTTRLFSGVFQGEVVGNRNQEEGDHHESTMDVGNVEVVVVPAY